MSPMNDRDETGIPTDGVEDDPNEDEEEDDEDERPEDAVDCPQCDQWSVDPDCSLCGGQRWVFCEDLDEFLGDNRVPCLQCGGEGEADGPGPVSWSCPLCLGTGSIADPDLASLNLAAEDLSSEVWRGADLSDASFSGATFTDFPLTARSRR